MKRIKLPKPPRCGECKALSRYEMDGCAVRVVEMHSCQCSKSEDFKKRAACLKSGGHDFETVSAGQHSFDVCSKCGAHG